MRSVCYAVVLSLGVIILELIHGSSILSEAKEKDIISRIRSNIIYFGKRTGNSLLFFCIIFFKSAVADLSSISGASMTPTLLDGDKVWVNKLAYDIKVPLQNFLSLNWQIRKEAT